MNRRGFFGLLGKLLAVGTAMSVSPKLLAPLKAVVVVDPVVVCTGIFSAGKAEFFLAS